MVFALNPPVAKKIIGHRGAAGLAAENTFESFRQAQACNLNWVEFDVQRCATGEWVVIHDETLDRTTPGNGYVAKTAYSEIQTLNVPSLESTLDLLLRLNLQPNIEIKGQYPDPNKAMAAFLNTLSHAWPAMMPAPLISSFDLNLLLSLKSQSPKLLLGYIVEHFSLIALDIAKKQGFYSLHCQYDSIPEETLTLLDQNPFPLLLFTVNDPHIAKMLLQHRSVAAIFSDFPNLIG